MFVSLIETRTNNFFLPLKNKNKEKESQKQFKIINKLNNIYPKEYYISFLGRARVGKSLNDFYQRNINFAPKTFLDYTENLSDEKRNNLTPLEAQYFAFELLELCKTPDDIKSVFVDEPLFQNLKSINNTNATKGLLYDVKIMQEDLKAQGESVLKNDEDLTVYIVKKIFLEGKTLKEINEDLDKDLNPIFKKENNEYLFFSTIKALGVKFPKVEYVNSLKYTRDGYSDLMAEKLSKKWKSLSEKEKEERLSKLKEEIKQKRDEKTQLELEKERIKRSQVQKMRWENMTPSEKTHLIESLQTGSKEQQMIMINAWNKCEEVRIALSRVLVNNHIANPFNRIYEKNKYSKVMSEIMNKFWENNPEYARIISDAIEESKIEIKLAKEQGNYSELIENIKISQKEAKKQFELRKNSEIEDLIEINKELCIKENPYFPDKALDEVCEYIARKIYAQNDVAVAFRNLNIEKPGMARRMKYAQTKELIECCDDFMTAQLLSILKGDGFHVLCRELKKGNLHPKIDFGCSQGEYTLHFKKQPRLENINRNYEQYCLPLDKKQADENTNVAVNAMKILDKQQKIGIKINSKTVQKIKNLILEYGSCTNEIAKRGQIAACILMDITTEVLKAN